MIHLAKDKGERIKDKGEGKMMVSQWEEFLVGPNGTGEELHVTLSRKGEILVGAKAFEKMGKPDAAVLLYDKVNSLIGVLPTNVFAKNGYPLNEKTNGRHRVMRAYRFCRHYGIRVEKTVAFDTAEIDGEGILVLDLKRMSGIGRQKDKG